MDMGEQFHIELPAYERFDRALARQEYVVINGPRGSGKTTFLHYKFARMAQEQDFYLPVTIAFRPYEKLLPEEWYEQVFGTILDAVEARLGKRLSLPYVVTGPRFFMEMLKHILNSIPGVMLIIMLDEVESTPIPLKDGFYAVLRSMLDQRTAERAFRRCIFVFAGRFIPEKLVTNVDYSPFHMAERLHMTDWDRASFNQLLNRGNLLPAPPTPEVLESLFWWSKGDLGLVTDVCHLLRKHDVAASRESIRYIVTNPAFLEPFKMRVNRVLAQHPLLREHLSHIKQGGHVGFTYNSSLDYVTEGWLAGVVREKPVENHQSVCAIRSPFYELVLHELQVANFDTPPRQPTQANTFERERFLFNNNSRVGDGGTSFVYRATDTVTGQIVAIKEFARNIIESTNGWDRFKKESVALAKFTHPNIVRYMGHFIHGDVPYLVMEFVPSNLHLYVHQSPAHISVSEALSIIRQVADALNYMHGQRYIHRDIKPKNILMDAENTPKLADFGISRSLNDPTMTQAGEILGTWAYIAPELMMGAHDASVQSDMWSLGVVFFEVLARRRLFNGADVASITNDVMFGTLPDISALRSDVRPDVKAILTRLLEREPERRFASARDLCNAIDAVQARLR
jgi:energy-coupling factor transporter ATP-binding protein EcfA2